MSYEHRPVNPNKGGVTRSGNLPHYGLHRAPDMSGWKYAALVVFVIGLWVVTL